MATTPAPPFVIYSNRRKRTVQDRFRYAETAVKNRLKRHPRLRNSPHRLLVVHQRCACLVSDLDHHRARLGMAVASGLTQRVCEEMVRAPSSE
jgi:hypothetical protein